MKGFDVLHIKSAVKSRNRFDLSFTHLTTLDFGQIVPLLAMETVGGDQFPINADYFSRMAPLVKPTYGKFQFKTVSAFVPYHQVAYDADAWFAGKTTWEGVTPVHRYITVFNLAQYIITYCVTTTGATSSNSKFTYVDASGTTVYNLLTNKGRYFVKVLTCLGYTLPQGVDFQTSSVWYNSVRSQHLSAYPLLAFFKLYNDYMSQSQRYNSSPLSDFLRSVKYNINVSGYSNGNITSGGLDLLFSNLYLNYENDYFTSAWQQPNNAINSIENINSAGVPQSSTQSPALGTVVDSVQDNVLNAPSTGTVTYIGQRALDWLKAFDDWVRRNNYSGSRAVQQVYSRFGIKTDDYRSHYAQIISTDSMPIQVGDVTATANEANVPLGDYAGKGIMNGSKSIDIKVSDYGLILILGYFTVSPMNAFGYDRKVLRSNPLDYYNPEFDGIGADPISVGEFWASPLVVGDTAQDNSIFGFTERYNSYRFGRDMITGDFRDYRAFGDMNCWHSGRNLSAIRSAGNLVAQSTSVNTLPQENSEYNRIFSVTSGDVDHFYLTARFKIDAVRPMLNLNQVVRLGEGDTTVPRNGNVIS